MPEFTEYQKVRESSVDNLNIWLMNGVNEFLKKNMSSKLYILEKWFKSLPILKHTFIWWAQWKNLPLLSKERMAFCMEIQIFNSSNFDENRCDNNIMNFF